MPKQTLSLGLGVTSPVTEPPDVVSSLVTGKIGPNWDPVGPEAIELCAPNSSLELAMVRSSKVREGDG